MHEYAGGSDEPQSRGCFRKLNMHYMLATHNCNIKCAREYKRGNTKCITCLQHIIQKRLFFQNYKSKLLTAQVAMGTFLVVALDEESLLCYNAS